jgi:hypothetical protein
MTDLALSPMQLPHPRRAGLRRLVLRAATALAVVVTVSLWLLALPALLSRQGFVLRSDEGCPQSAWRDPVTGRPSPAPTSRCTTSRMGTSP